MEGIISKLNSNGGLIHAEDSKHEFNFSALKDVDSKDLREGTRVHFDTDEHSGEVLRVWLLMGDELSSNTEDGYESLDDEDDDGED